MSDEAHMESAWRHRDLTAPEQWHGPRPDEALMAAEEWQPELDGKDVVEALMVYLFAEEMAELSANASLRLYAVVVFCTPWLMAVRPRPDVEGLWARAKHNGQEPLADFKRRCDDARFGEKLGRFFEVFLPTGKDWLETGTWKFYLIARHLKPWFVRHGQDLNEMTFERMAKVFEGEDLLTKESRDRARSRWSARAQEVLRKPLERAGVAGGVSFSKSATARGRMRESAKGNQNRRKAATGLPEVERREGNAELRDRPEAPR